MDEWRNRLARRSYKPQVTDSNSVSSTRPLPVAAGRGAGLNMYGLEAQPDERPRPKRDIAGSNPV